MAGVLLRWLPNDTRRQEIGDVTRIVDVVAPRPKNPGGPDG